MIKLTKSYILIFEQYFCCLCQVSQGSLDIDCKRSDLTLVKVQHVLIDGKV